MGAGGVGAAEGDQEGNKGQRGNTKAHKQKQEDEKNTQIETKWVKTKEGIVVELPNINKQQLHGNNTISGNVSENAAGASMDVNGNIISTITPSSSVMTTPARSRETTGGSMIPVSIDNQIKRGQTSINVDEDTTVSLAITTSNIAITGLDSAGFRSGSQTPNEGFRPTEAPDHSHQEEHYGTLQIDYQIPKHGKGIVSNLPECELSPYKYTTIYTTQHTNTSWMPCLNSQHVKATWEITFSVPATLNCYHSQSTGSITEERETIVVCSGELFDQCIDIQDPSRKLVTYKLAVPTSAMNIKFAIAPFHSIRIPTLLPPPRAANIPGHGVYALASHELTAELSHSVEIKQGFLKKVFDFLTSHIGVRFPYASFKYVFMDELQDEIIVGSTLVLLSSSLLHMGESIEQIIDIRRAMVYGATSQLFGQYITAKTSADQWVVHGLRGYTAGLFFKSMFGLNEYKYRLKVDIDILSKIDIDLPPLHALTPEDLEHANNAKLLELKSPLIFYMLERLMNKGAMQKVINRLFVIAISDELPMGISTSNLLRIIKKVSSKEWRYFFVQWAHNPRIPKFSCQYSFNRKKNTINLNIRQEKSSTQEHTFQGNLTVRVHEPEGVYDHVVKIETAEQKYELAYHTKYRRTKSNKKSKALQMKVEAEQEEKEKEAGLRSPTSDEELDEELVTESNNFGEWGDPDEEDSVMNNRPIAWIRVDPDTDWVGTFKFHQSDHMWATQLAKDKDVTAQYEAINHLAEMPSISVSSTLMKTALDHKAFHRVRSQALLAMSKSAIADIDHIGLKQLLLIYKKKFCIDTKAAQYLPRPNDFRNLQDYFLLKTLPIAIGASETNDQKMTDQLCIILVRQLRCNNNTYNCYSDLHYIISIIQGIGLACLPNKHPVPGIQALQSVVSELHQCLHQDSLINSRQNRITCVTLEVLGQLMSANVIPTDMAIFIRYSAWGNYAMVREMAFQNLILLGINNPAMMNYVALSVQADPDVSLRNRLTERFSEVAKLLRFAQVPVEPIQGITERSEAGIRLSGHNAHSEPVTPIMHQSMELLSALKKHPSAKVFLHPVDLKIVPDYLQNIGIPMDLSTIEQNLKTSLYLSMDDMYKDIRLMLSNCFVFNHDYDPIWMEGKNLEKYFEGLVAEHEARKESRLVISLGPAIALERAATQQTYDGLTLPININGQDDDIDSAWSEDLRRRFKRALEKLQQHSTAPLFMIAPNDEIAPEYSKVITKPMSFGIITEKFANSKYLTPGAATKDVKRLFKNCYKYNGPNDPVSIAARQLEKRFIQIWQQQLGVTIQPIKSNRPSSTVSNQQKTTETPKRTPIPKLQIKLEPSAAAQTPSSNAIPKLQLKLDTASVVAATPKVHLKLEPSTMSAPMTLKISSLPKALNPVSLGSPKLTKSNKIEERHSDNLKRKIAELLSTLKKNPNSAPFLTPVDSTAVPEYATVVKYPMDLSTIASKAKKGLYSDMAAVYADIHLMLNNCSSFNHKHDPVWEAGKSLETYFLNLVEKTSTAIKTLPKLKLSLSATPNPAKSKSGSTNNTPVVSRPTSAEETPQPKKPHSAQLTARLSSEWSPESRKQYSRALSRIMQHSCAFYFLEPPTDEVAPNYSSMIAKPIAFNPIFKKYKNAQYAAPTDLENDVQLIFTNCATYNKPDSMIYDLGRSLKKHWTTLSSKSGDLYFPEEIKCEEALTELFLQPNIGDFAVPVNDIIPGYNAKIKNPTDFGLIRSKLVTGEYTSPDQIAREAKQVFLNCYQFNGKASHISVQASKLEQQFSRIWQKHFGVGLSILTDGDSQPRTYGA